MDTKTVKNLLAPLQDLPRTNKFKRALDVAFAQGIPVEVQVAEAFRGFKSAKTGKRYKVRIVNTKTGQNTGICRIRIERRDEVQQWSAAGKTYIGFDRERVIKESGVENPKDISEWAHSEEVIADTSWAEIGFAISKLFKSDLVYFDTCGKCGGSGRIPRFFHICEGICFECLGTGGRLAVDYNEVERAKNNAVTSSAPEV